ncbi:glycosyltransferase family 4 protein [Bosea sp. (in: a-proteobacteria)]|uniref:glycosyltransferase family 4 protein n=1 Tax=Bosea sp. (in: a-proteobacteria) TaxID=1871050 RepID=UPI0025C2BD17|nr:glycosyltransferase family 4 protein [Bosea sp. (in: a-proteobacteria)]MBR3194205.1 glycosyltransferase family 4 protein [Bosea sp. (in: a-proteobacteria)]
MKIAFHTPLNRYGDGAPSGDRLMARQLVTLLEELGHAVEILPAERSFMREPDPALLAARKQAAQEVVAALSERWQAPEARPDLIFTYHCHYRAPDLIGPPLAERFDLPFVVAEASDAQKRFDGPWAEAAALARTAILRADLHLCMTERDREGLSRLIPELYRLIELSPFLLGVDEVPEHMAARRATDEPVRLIAVAMMRPGNKAACYVFLARTLARIADLPWTLTLIGDGPERPAIEAAFASLPPGRVRFLGRRERTDILSQLAAHDLFVWPGLNEAYGVVYLEAQAAGLPVAALDSGGVPAVVARDRTALLARHGDEAALSAKIGQLIGDSALRARMGEAARDFARQERNGESARAVLATALSAAVARHGRKAQEVAL